MNKNITEDMQFTQSVLLFLPPKYSLQTRLLNTTNLFVTPGLTYIPNQHVPMHSTRNSKELDPYGHVTGQTDFCHNGIPASGCVPYEEKRVTAMMMLCRKRAQRTRAE